MCEYVCTKLAYIDAIVFLGKKVVEIEVMEDGI